MKTNANRREFLRRMLALACSTIALASCQNTVTGPDERYPDPYEEDAVGGEGGGY